MKNIYGILIALFIYQFAYAQAPEIEWQNGIGGSQQDYFSIIRQTADEGYIIAGYSQSGISGDKTEVSNGGYDYWVIKLDNTGAIEWQNTIGGDGTDELSSIDLTDDGGCILGGKSYSGISGDKTENIKGFSGDDCWIIKLDSDGGIQWQKTIGGFSSDECTAIEQTSDGGYLMGAVSKSDISGDKTESFIGDMFHFDYWIVKLDAAGNIQWQNTIGGTKDDMLTYAHQNEDGSYIVGGYSNSNISGDKTEDNISIAAEFFDYWAVKLDTAGNIIWENTIGGTRNEILRCALQTPDGGYLLGGFSDSDISSDKTEDAYSLAAYDYWVIKLNVEGDIEWQNTIGGLEGDQLFSMQQTTDGGYILGGGSYSGVGGDKTEPNYKFSEDYWLVKINSSGSIEWDNTIGGKADDGLRCIAQTSDGGYIMGGNSLSGMTYDKTDFSNGSYDLWIVKLYPDPLFCAVVSTITPSGLTNFCAGENVVLTAPTETGYTYKWYKNGILVPPATSSSMTITKPGNYKVEISNGTCSDISDEITITVNPKPSATITNVDITNDLCFDSSIKLKANNGAGFSWQWYKGAAAIGGATGNVYFATIIGNYKVKITNASGCEKMSAPYSIISSCKKMSNEQSVINIYPNPNTGEFILHIDELINEEIISITIKNMLGEEIYFARLAEYEEDHQISLDKTLANGVYVVEISAGNNIYKQQIVIEK